MTITNPSNNAATFSIMTAEEKVARARTWLLRNKPMWGSLLMRLKIREHRGAKTQTMITDGRALEWARPFVDEMSVDETCGVLAHEVGHCMLKHVFRQGGRDHKAWEEAADHVINLLLLEDGFRLPGDPMVDAQFKGMSAEQVYPIILAQHEKKQEQEEKQKQQQQKSNSSKGKGQQQDDEQDDEPQQSMGEMAEPGTLGEPGEEQSQTDEEKEEQQKQKKEKEQQADQKKEGAGEAQQAPDDAAEEQQEDEHQQGQGSDEPGEGEPEEGDEQQAGADEGEQSQGEPQPLSEAEMRDLEGDWAQAAAAAAQQAVRRGHGSANQQRAVLQSNAAPISFEEYVRYFLQRCTDRSEQTWRRQARRSITSENYLPGRRGTRTGALVAIIDTSGSISEKALGKFSENIRQAQSDLRPEMIIAIFADDEVMNEVRFDRSEEFAIGKMDAKGGGGTDFRPAFKRVVEIRETEGIDIAGVLYLTDLEGDMPKAKDAIDYPPTLWCFDSSSCYSRQEHEELVKSVTFGEVAELQI